MLCMSAANKHNSRYEFHKSYVKGLGCTIAYTYSSIASTLLCTVSLYIVHSNFHSMLSITTRFCTDLQLRGGARAIVRLGLIVTMWSPSARSENVKGEEPTCTYNVCIWRDRHYKNLISYFITSQIHRYWNLSYLEMTLKIKLHLE